MTNLSIFQSFYNVFWSPFNGPFESLRRPSGIPIFGRSQNAVKPLENQHKASNQTLQNDEIVNIPQLLHCFLKSVQRTSWVAPKALWNSDFRSFTKCSKTNRKATTSFKSDPSKWRNCQYSTAFTWFFWNPFTAACRSLLPTPLRTCWIAVVHQML